ncbi:hypothetical protein CWI39_2937p0020 [Hamiltosporidium magnivora]|uniref:Uncharacterized protein n=1 Tax=Hamiltosporidium magnivora TaxID=148818 RepID=A0A4Q9KRV5_9MICR|nr:hypothetical protein CWI39_2937p0020 [Hamiltosporidium magnivora]
MPTRAGRERTNVPFKRREKREDGVKKRKNIILLISEEGTALMKPTNSINEESDWEEETEVVKEQKKTCKKW